MATRDTVTIMRKRTTEDQVPDTGQVRCQGRTQLQVTHTHNPPRHRTPPESGTGGGGSCGWHQDVTHGGGAHLHQQPSPPNRTNRKSRRTNREGSPERNTEVRESSLTPHLPCPALALSPTLTSGDHSPTRSFSITPRAPFCSPHCSSSVSVHLFGVTNKTLR